MIKEKNRSYTKAYMIKKLSCHISRKCLVFGVFVLFCTILSCCLMGVYMARQLQDVEIYRVILCCLIVFSIYLYLM